MLYIPPKFKSDINGRDTNLIPLVLFGTYSPGETNHDYDANNSPFIAISTNSVTVGSDYFKPLLLSIPGIKESIGIERRNYKISNVTLSVANIPYDGKRFTELLEETSAINMEVRIFWASPSITGTTLYDFNPDWVDSGDADGSALLVFYGVIRDYKYNDEKSLVLY